MYKSSNITQRPQERAGAGRFSGCFHRDAVIVGGTWEEAVTLY